MRRKASQILNFSQPLITRGYKTKLHITDTTFEGESGIRATIFGATGFLGKYTGAVLGGIGSDLYFPIVYPDWYDDKFRELRLSSISGKTAILENFNFEDQRLIERSIKTSNVVINQLGPRPDIKYRSDFEYVNIELPRRIAKAVAANPDIKRFIHFSAAAASPYSPSIDYQTKYIGEQVVREICPDVTILRPTVMYGEMDKFAEHIISQRYHYHKFNLVFDDCTALKQPILVNDVATATLNALKIDDTVGKTYDLGKGFLYNSGGPNQHELREIYEIIFNITKQRPALAYVNRNLMLFLTRMLPNREYFNMDYILKRTINEVVSEGANGIDQLFVKPVSFVQGVEAQLTMYKQRFMGDKELDHR